MTRKALNREAHPGSAVEEVANGQYVGRGALALLPRIHVADSQQTLSDPSWFSYILLVR